MKEGKHIRNHEYNFTIAYRCFLHYTHVSNKALGVGIDQVWNWKCRAPAAQQISEHIPDATENEVVIQ
jgi:hypothetical protein